MSNDNVLVNLQFQLVCGIGEVLWLDLIINSMSGAAAWRDYKPQISSGVGIQGGRLLTHLSTEIISPDSSSPDNEWQTDTFPPGCY